MYETILSLRALKYMPQCIDYRPYLLPSVSVLIIDPTSSPQGIEVYASCYAQAVGEHANAMGTDT